MKKVLLAASILLLLGVVAAQLANVLGDITCTGSTSCIVTAINGTAFSLPVSAANGGVPYPPTSGAVLGATSATALAWSSAGVTGNVMLWGGAGATPTDAGVPAAQGCISGCRYMLLYGDDLLSVRNASAAAVVATGNVLQAFQFTNTVTRKLGNGYFGVTTGATGHVGTAVYCTATSQTGCTSIGTRVWTSGAVSTSATGNITFTTTAYTLQPGTWVLGSCMDNTTAIAIGQSVTSGGTTETFFGGTNAPAHTMGLDTTDVCVGGAPPSSITLSNITNATASAVEFYLPMITN